MGGRAGGGARSGGGARTKSLPTLTGSEKQVAWANDIRQNVVDAISFVASQPRPGREKEVKALTSRWLSKAKEMTKATQWIDARYDLKMPKVVKESDWHSSFRNKDARKAATLSENQKNLGSYVGVLSSFFGK